MFKKKLLKNYMNEEQSNLDESLVFDGQKWTKSKITHSDEDDPENPCESEKDKR